MIHKKSLAENRMCKDCNWVQLFHRRFLGSFEYKSVRRNYLCWESFITRFPLSHCRLNSADKSLAKWRSLSHEANFRVLSILQTELIILTRFSESSAWQVLECKIHIPCESRFLCNCRARTGIDKLPASRIPVPILDDGRSEKAEKQKLHALR